MVQLTEFTTARPIGGGRIIYTKRDVFGSDGIAINKHQIIFWNSKHATNPKSRTEQIRQARQEMAAFPFPECVKIQVVMWEARKPPDIIDL